MNIRRKIHYFAFDVDGDKYTHMAVGCGSLLAASFKQVDYGYTSFTPNPQEITLKHAPKYAEGVINAVKTSSSELLDILFGVYIWNDRLTREVIRLVRAAGITHRIILGGPQITWARAGFLNSFYPEADVFIRGEGEEVLPKVVSTTNRLKLPGVYYVGEPDDGLMATADLTKLPSPFLDTFLIIPAERVHQARWETKRGCPFSCHFCQHRGSGEKPREFNMERLEKEIHWFCKHEIRKLTVLDPIFNVGKTYMPILTQLHKIGYRDKLSLQCRFECINDDFLNAVGNFDACLEFGLQSIHPEECKAIGRANKMTEVRTVMEKLNQMGQHYEVDLMYGLPGQTVSSFQESIEFCQKNKVPKIRSWPLKLLRGTRLDDHNTRKLWELTESDEQIPLVKSCKTFNENDWEKMNEISQQLWSYYGENE